MLYEKQQRDLKLPKIRCQRCGREFPKRKDHARFCSDRCRVSYAQAHRAVTIIKTDLATVSEAARIAGVSKSTIRRWAKAGRLRTETVIGRVLVYRADVEGVKGLA